MKHALRRRWKPAPPDAAAQAAWEKRLLREEWWISAFSVGLFAALPREPQTAALFADAFRLGAAAAVPVCTPKGAYAFRFVAENAKWRRNAHRIQEPVESRPVPKDGLRVILVPGVAFDAAGARLGRGGGHYDRLLASFPNALLVGCAFESAVSPDPLPREKHDIPMDAVFTEKRTRYMPSAAAKLARMLEGGAP